MRKVVVTGGAGFIGSHLVDALIERGIEVHIVDKEPKHINPKAILHVGDISNPKDPSLGRALVKADCVFHLAAETSVEESIFNIYKYHINNVNVTLNVLHWARREKVKNVIFSSSSSVYGEPQYTPIDEKHPLNPMSPYALSKMIGEQYCSIFTKLYGINTVCLRYFNVYGNRMGDSKYQNVISTFRQQYNNNKPLTIVNNGEQKRDFIHVNDIVEANIQAAGLTKPYIFNVGTGNGITINQIANMFGGEKTYEDTRIEPMFSISDNTYIKNVLNWESKYELEPFIKQLKSK